MLDCVITETKSNLSSSRIRIHDNNEDDQLEYSEALLSVDEEPAIIISWP